MQNRTTTADLLSSALPIGNNMLPAVLHLNLTKKWFDMIEAGEKKEEYREIKPFWNRVFSCYIKIKGRNYHPTDVLICFSNGYSKNRRQMFVRCKYVKPGFGKPEWGAEPNKQYHVLSLGDVVRA